MDTLEAVELVVVIFSRMNREERQALIRLLKSMRPKMDFDYPNGIKELSPACAQSSTSESGSEDTNK